jgi:hypothetical protein
MTPEQVSIITAIAAILDKIGTWPISTILAMIVIGPWMVLIAITLSQERRSKAMKQMYEDNVCLVKDYEKLSNEQQDVIIMNTSAITELTTIVKERVK